jgi:hypothetical protein
MRKLMLVAAVALACASVAGCANFSEDLSAVGTDLGILAADLPTACGNLIAAQTALAALPGLPAKAQTALNTGNANISKYCGPAAAAVTNVQTAITAVQAATVAITAAKSGS